MEKKIIGIDLGGTSIKFAIISLAGEVQQKWSIPTNILDEGSHIVDDIIDSIRHRLDLLGLTNENFAGIGMGSPGVVDREKGTVIGAYNLNWKTLQPLKEKIEGALGIPFFIDNDANVAALGEKWMGAVVYLSRKHGYIRSFRQMGVQYAGLLIINIVLGFINSAVDNYGHLGGLVGGYLVMTAISFRGDRLTKPASRIAGIVAYFVIAILLFALGMKR